MRNACLVVTAVAALFQPAVAGDPAEVVVAGPLSPAEGLTLAGRVEGGSVPALVQLWRYTFDVNGRWSHDSDVEVGPRVRVEAQMTALPGQFVEVANLPEVARVEIRPQRGPWREIAAQDRRLVSMGADYEPSVVEFLAPGRYEWRAESLEAVPRRAWEIVVSEDRITVQLAPTFAPGRVLHGRLRSRFGRALASVRVRFAVREDDAWRLLPTKDTRSEERTGAFEIRGLSAGHWRAQLDDAAEVVLGEFDVADKDVTREFTFVPR